MHIPFSVGDLGICKQRFGRFSENPDKFRNKFVRLGLTYSHLAGHHGYPGPLLQPESVLRDANMQMAYWPPTHSSKFIRGVRMQSQNMTHAGTMRIM